MRAIQRLLIGAVFGFVMAAAHAASVSVLNPSGPISLGLIGPVPSTAAVSHTRDFFPPINNTTFNDYITFSLSSPGQQGTVGGANASFSFFSIPFVNIANLQFSLYRPVGGIDIGGIVEGADAPICTNCGLNFTQSPAGGASFYLLVTGTVSGVLRGQYTTSISAARLPAAVWLLAAGLVGLVGIARRKKVPIPTAQTA